MYVKSMAEILEICRSLEKISAGIYNYIAENASDAKHRAFWAEIVEDENRHVTYWDRLIDMHKSGKLRPVFEDPARTWSDLKASEQKVVEMVGRESELTDVGTAIRFALRMEAFMLNPAFAVLFNLLEESEHIPSPGNDYETHLLKFRSFIEEVDPDNPEWKLLGEVLSMMWSNNRQIAAQFLQIKTLQGLLPMCASCKKIRDDDGYWNKVESYLSQRSDVQFSHGICPDCQRKYYPELFEP